MPQEKKDEARKICKGIAYARTEEHYSILCNQLEEKVPGDFHKYFLDNWHACRHMWVHCWRGSSSHMGNQNREIGLRVFTGKLKRTYTQTWHRKEIQTSHKVIVSLIKTRYRCGDDLAITDAIQSIATLIEADIILQAPKEAWRIEATIANKDASNHFTVTVGDVSYNVATMEACLCECTCFMSQLLHAATSWLVFSTKEHLFRRHGSQRDGRGSKITTGPLHQVRWLTSQLWWTAPRWLIARNSVKWTDFFGTLPTGLPTWGTKTCVLDFTLL